MPTWLILPFFTIDERTLIPARLFGGMPAEPITLTWPTCALCVALIVGIVALGVMPGTVIDSISNSLAGVTAGPATALLGR